MSDYLTLDQFVEILEHNRDNAKDSDIWLLLNEEGETAIVPDQDITEFQNPATWPRYICRAEAINAHVASDTRRAADPNNPMAAVDGLYSALDYINFIIRTTIVQRMTPSTAARLVIQALRRKASQ